MKANDGKGGNPRPPNEAGPPPRPAVKNVWMSTLVFQGDLYAFTSDGRCFAWWGEDRGWHRCEEMDLP